MRRGPGRIKKKECFPEISRNHVSPRMLENKREEVLPESKSTFASEDAPPLTEITERKK